MAVQGSLRQNRGRGWRGPDRWTLDRGVRLEVTATGNVAKTDLPWVASLRRPGLDDGMQASRWRVWRGYVVVVDIRSQHKERKVAGIVGTVTMVIRTRSNLALLYCTVARAEAIHLSAVKAARAHESASIKQRLSNVLQSRIPVSFPVIPKILHPRRALGLARLS